LKTDAKQQQARFRVFVRGNSANQSENGAQRCAAAEKLGLVDSSKEFWFAYV
jgi:hypothetical protein